MLLSTSAKTSTRKSFESIHRDTSEEKSQSVTPPAREQSEPLNHSSAITFESDDSSLRPSLSDIAIGVRLYFQYCHRQPIWCFDHEDVHDCGAIPEELACSILALTSRFLDNRSQLQFHGETAKTLIMLRIANGTVGLGTVESLCLLSYSSFVDGNHHLGQFHLGLAFQVCRSAMLDLESSYRMDDPLQERKKRCFWSLQLLQQCYGRQDGVLSLPSDIWGPLYAPSNGGSTELDPTVPPLPRDELGCAGPHESGIWNTGVHLAWVWSQVRKYVTDCAHNVLREPWRRDSPYARVISDFMEIENRIPVSHRYDTAKFYKRKVEEIKVNRDYWAPWLREQFTYHAIHTVMNHPFIYIIGAQHNPNLAIPNTFWKRSSELALLHATWIVRMIDMVVDKQVPLADPFFGHVAAIAATVHLYYCCAAAARLKHKSNADFTKCRRFLKNFIPYSAACAGLDRNLDKMTRMAVGPESMDVEDWMPSKIYLSIPLMWETLRFTTEQGSLPNQSGGILDGSLIPPMSHEDTDEDSTIEIIVATSPEIIINTAEGGQEAPSFSHRGPGQSSRSAAWNSQNIVNSGSNQQPQHRGAGGGSSSGGGGGEKHGEQMDFLSFNFTPWLYADSAQFANMGDMGLADPQPAMPEDRGSAWWQGENFSNIMFNHF
ncbi:uncharacterized protein J7T54_005495 [Emericellopsis cladophorae]|uniref:Xylanolytic transcriptional activator regulatory domain-containing protein n=1 Tax=Emericellopsis cladophorae TaxID=2686198 RepID=A0A9P9Y4W1_9HYPO|nr:uncharacterized protein J7T54_005495 [Emericellopsis cladophorae]KAI6783466.1 hypothetical protein J7T54_005495 [Emericellopsis cladophorae]